jgi:hypothetical protein
VLHCTVLLPDNQTTIVGIISLKLSFSSILSRQTLHSIMMRQQSSVRVVMTFNVILSLVAIAVTNAWVTTTLPITTSTRTRTIATTKSGRRCRSVPSNIALSSSTEEVGFLHGQSSCFLPLAQLDQDYYAPRIIQVRYFYSYISMDCTHVPAHDMAPALTQQHPMPPPSPFRLLVPTLVLQKPTSWL